jgi:hypothetical protein
MQGVIPRQIIVMITEIVQFESLHLTVLFLYKKSIPVTDRGGP